MKPDCQQEDIARNVVHYRTFCIMSQRINVCGKLKLQSNVGVAKASLNRATEFVGSDPKPSDLGMARLKAR